MASRPIGIATGLAVLVLAGVFAVLHRHPESTPPPAPEAERQPPEAGAHAAKDTVPSADLKQLPPEIRTQVAQALEGADPKSVRIASVDPRRARGSGKLQFLFTPPASDAPSWQREAWDKYMAPLIYPEGHPRAGQWRDSVSAEDVERSAMPLAEKFYPPDYLDQPMLHIPEKRINFDELNMAASRLWRHEDPSTAPAFYEWLKNAPEDPSAPPGEYWLPAPAGHPEATTQRKALSEEIERQAAQQIEEQRAKAGS